MNNKKSYIIISIVVGLFLEGIAGAVAGIGIFLTLMSGVENDFMYGFTIAGVIIALFIIIFPNIAIFRYFRKSNDIPRKYVLIPFAAQLLMGMLFTAGIFAVALTR